MTTETYSNSPDDSAVKGDDFGRNRHIFFIVALIGYIIDQATKAWIVREMPLNTRQFPFPEYREFFRFTHIANEGVAFGIWQDGFVIFTILAMGISIGVAWFNWTLPTNSVKLRVALGLVWAGALGNLTDRLRIGHVTDFLDFDVSSIIDVPLANWPVFNVADMCVVGGAIIMAYVTIFDPEAIEPPPPSDQDRPMSNNPPTAILPDDQVAGEGVIASAGDDLSNNFDARSELNHPPLEEISAVKEIEAAEEIANE